MQDGVVCVLFFLVGAGGARLGNGQGGMSERDGKQDRMVRVCGSYGERERMMRTYQ